MDKILDAYIISGWLFMVLAIVLIPNITFVIPSIIALVCIMAGWRENDTTRRNK